MLLREEASGVVAFSLKIQATVEGEGSRDRHWSRSTCHGLVKRQLSHLPDGGGGPLEARTSNFLSTFSVPTAPLSLVYVYSKASPRFLGTG